MNSSLVIACAIALLLAPGCSREPGGVQSAPAPAAKADPSRKLAQEYSDARALYDLANQPTKSPADRTPLLEQIVRDFPNSEVYKDALYQLAFVYSVQSRMDDAAQAYAKYAALFPEGLEALNAINYVVASAKARVTKAPPEMKAKAEEELKSVLAQAVEALSRRIEKESAADDPLAYGNLALYRSELGENDEVIRLTGEVIKAFPRFDGDGRDRFMQADVPDALRRRATALTRRFEATGDEADREVAIRDLETCREFLKSGAQARTRDARQIEEIGREIEELRVLRKN